MEFKGGENKKFIYDKSEEKQGKEEEQKKHGEIEGQRDREIDQDLCKARERGKTKEEKKKSNRRTKKKRIIALSVTNWHS